MKYIYRMPPCDLYDVSAVESWLGDMAQGGFVLDKIARTRFRFLKTMPCDIRFRLEPITGDEWEPERDAVDYYEAAGWEYAAKLNNLFYIWKTRRADAEELHTDPVVQSETYSRLCKKLTRDAVGGAVCVAAMLAIIICAFALSPRPVMLFLTSPVILLLAPVNMIAISETIRSALLARRTKKLLQDGVRLEHRKDYRRGLAGRRALNILSLALSLIVLTVSVLTLTLDWHKSVSEVERPLPFLPLDAIEKDEDFVWPREPFVYRGVDANNSVRFTWTPLVPVSYSIYQQGGEQNRLWEDGSGFYRPSAQTDYYRPLLSSWASALLDELIESDIEYWDNPAVTELNHPEFDRAVLAVKGESSKLFARRDNHVVYIRYYGDARLEERLDDLAAALDAAK